MDFEFMTNFYHAYSYSLSYALSNLLGPAQATFMYGYAKALTKIFGGGDSDFSKLINDIETYTRILREKRLVRDIVMEEIGGNRVRLIVKGCALAESTHSTPGLAESKDYLCPIAAMAMVALAKERGFKDEENIFDYIKFSGSLSTLTEEGSVTEFLLSHK